MIKVRIDFTDMSNIIRTQRDAWIRDNKQRISKATLGTVAVEMRKLGFYSKKAPILTCAQSLLNSCRRLEIEL